METIKLIENLEMEAFGSVSEAADVKGGDLMSEIEAVESVLNEL